jgi:MFS family permease
MYNEEDRGGMMAGFVLGINIGLILGQLMAGFIAQHATFRWIFWVMVVSIVVAAIISFHSSGRPTYLSY